ncbi:transmembrane protein 51a [Pholidichthys leucotaenia]
MRSSVGVPPDPLGSDVTHNNNNNSNNRSSVTRGNSGSQYALCALGVGLIALGIVMIVWSVVPTHQPGNGSGPGVNDSSRRNKASSVAFVLTGSGVIMLLLSLCLGMRNKQREQRLQQAQNQNGETTRTQEREMTEEEAQRYAVPTYEEAVGSGQYPVRQSNHRPSTSQLPSYEDLVQVDGLQYENEGSTNEPQPTSTAAESASSHRPGKNNRKLLPVKVRRIKSEKLHGKNVNIPQPTPEINIEPLTPPPQYEDKVPPL